MLRAHGVHASVGARVLVRALALSLEPGTVTAIVGPNGAGKSTLLRGLAGLAPLQGDVQLDGHELASVDARTRARALAYLPQRTAVSAGLTVRDVVRLGRLPHRGRFAGLSTADNAIVDASLERMQVQGFADRPLHTLSGGERQRVMLARMLATEAPTMLLDEPTTALDIRHALDLLRTLRALADEGRAVLVAMHDLTHADAFAHRVVCLHADAEGTVTHGSTAEVLTPARLQTVFEVPFVRDGEGRLRVCVDR